MEQLSTMTMIREPMLFTPWRVRGTTFPNRVVLAPMQMYMAGPDGLATDWHLQHLGKYALGGFGTVMTEGLIIEPRGRCTYGDCGIWADDQIPPLRRITAFLHQRGVLAAAQLHHAGPKAGRQRPWDGLGALDAADAAEGEAPWQPVSSSGGGALAGYREPRALALDEIGALVGAYAMAARRADAAGFDVLDIHAAHGYLLHTFLSPVANARTDRYGGDLDGRMRLVLEVAEAVRAVWPETKPILFRVSCVDWRKDLDDRSDGWRIEDSIVLARELKDRGIDAVDCSSGGIRTGNTMVDQAQKRRKITRGHQVPYAEAIRREAGIATMAVGVILDGPQAEAILQAGRADLVAIGRQALHDPHWALHAARELGADPDRRLWPASYGFWLELRDRVGIEGVASEDAPAE